MVLDYVRFWRGRVSRRGLRTFFLSGVAPATFATVAFAAGPLPMNGKIVAGSASLAKGTNGLTINQSTSRAIIDWKSFSIGAGNSVFFNNGSGATLNRVTGKSLSQIDGLLNSTGSVFLINPNGVVIGSGGKVITNGSFVTSTRDLSDSSFLSGGAYQFAGSSNGAVNNQGTITSTGGDVVLVGKSVSNSGTISAPQGTAALAAGDNVTLKPVNGDQRIAVAAGTGSVTNTGSVNAAAAELKAADGNVYALAGNSGVVRATGTETVGGHIWLTSSGGDVQVTGTAAASNADGSGGAVTARGASIEVPGTIDASATAAGQSGGTASIIATGTTTVTGTIKATGGAGGQGGTVETSGHTLSIGGALVDAGMGGHWLLDPDDIVVDIASALTIDNTLNAGTDVSLQTTSSAASTSVGVTTQPGSGDIIVESPLGWGTTAKLTLNAYRNIDIEAPIAVSGGGTLSMIYADTSGTGATDGNAADGAIYYNGGNIQFTGGSGAGAALSINGANYTLLYDATGVEAINASDAALQGSYALADPIDASSIANWTPIGTDGAGDVGNGGNGFSGIFDGLGNTISNLTVDIGSSNSYAGLFGYSSGKIRNIGIVGGSVTGNGDVGGLVGKSTGTINNSFATDAVSGGLVVGGLVGYEEGGTISDSYATGTVGGTINIGGLVGENDLGAISGSYATGTVTGSFLWAGGLVGNIQNGSVTDSYATGAVNGASTVGGLVGALGNGSTISDSYATGAVTGSASVGAVVGDDEGSVTNAYWDTDTGISDPTAGAGNRASDPGITGLTTAALTAALPTGWDPAVWANAGNKTTPYLMSNAGPVYVAGDNTDLFNLIFTAAQFQAINANSATLSENYALANSVDASSIANWIPIGTDGQGNASGTYSGIFDGLGNTISNVTVPGNNGYAGVFGVLSGTIRNLGAIGGSISGGSVVGGLVALTGPNAVISNSYATNAVSGEVDVGGLVGFNQGSIVASYATGAVTGDDASSYSAGGLAGFNIGTIGHSYATGAVIAGDYVGGLVGQDDAFGPGENGAITDSYAVGAVNSNNSGSNIGGLAGYNFNGTVTDSYWDTETTGQTHSAGSDDSYGLTTAALTAALPGSFDPTVWANVDDQTTPYLISNPGPVFLGSDGTHLFNLIFTTTQLQAINGNSSTLSENYALANSLDASSAVNWIPIGTDGAGNVENGGNGFSGIFDGLGNTISNLNVNIGSNDYAGLFGISTGTIRNVGLAGGSITGGANVGDLVGDNYGTIENSYATGAVNGSASVGGLVGDNDAGINTAISNSYAMGAVTGSFAVGGLVGYDSAASIDSSYATGTVSGATYAGGLVGYASGPIAHSYWDMQTSGITDRSAGAGISANYTGITGLTTSQLQAGLPAGFDSGIWSIVAGTSYPYLSTQFTGTPQVVSGIDYGNGATVAGTSVSLLDNGATLSSALTGGAATTGANGYYYYLLAPGTISANANIMAFDTSGANVAQVSGSTNGVDIVGGLLIVPTTAARYSDALTSAINTSLTGDADQGNAVAATLIAGLNHYGYVASGDFDLDLQDAPSGASVYVKTTGGDITVSTAQSWSNTNGLILDASGSIDIDHSISATGAGGNMGFVALAANDGGAGGDYSFGTGGKITFDGAAGGEADHLFLNGTKFTLETSIGQLASAIASDSYGDYALATDYNAATDGTNGVYAASPIGATFRGTFEGLGNTISNLSIDDTTSSDNVGLFALAQTGSSLRDINLTNATVLGADNAAVGILAGASFAAITGVTTAGTVTTGNSVGPGHTTQVGGIVGDMGNGSISNSSSSANVTAGNASAYQNAFAGGLVGEMDAGSVTGAYASGNVHSGHGTSAVPAFVGGLIGASNGTVTQSYATGNVSAGDYTKAGGLIGRVVAGTATLSYATGAVSAGLDSSAGGFAGDNFAAISQSYAMGSATGGAAGTSGVTGAGGFVGSNRSTGTIAESYSTGQATSSGQVTGGFIGRNLNSSNSALTSDYFDTQTSGTATGVGIGIATGVTGLDTGDLEKNVPVGFNTSAYSWRTSQDRDLFPYFLWQYPTNAPVAITGMVYGNGGVPLVTSGQVSFLEDGVAPGQASIGADGTYYTLLPHNGNIGPSSAILAYTGGASAGARLDVAINAYDGDNLSSFDIWGSTLIAPTAQATYSAAAATRLRDQDSSLIAQAVGNYNDPTIGLANDGYIATGPFDIDSNLTLPNGLYVRSEPPFGSSSDSSITVSHALTIPGSAALNLDATYVEFANNITVPGGGAVRMIVGEKGENYKIDDGDSISFIGPSTSGATFTINGEPYTLLYSTADIQALNDSQDALDGSYALAKSVDDMSAEFAPLGVDASGATLFCGCGFDGVFAGLGHTISNLTIDRPSVQNVGLFGHLEGTVRDLGIVGGSITGEGIVGALAGYSDGFLLNDYSTASVTGTGADVSGNNIGGLIGYGSFDSEIYYSHATGAVTGGQGAVGGLAGYTDGTIQNSYATGRVGGAGYNVGGFAGVADTGSEIESSYATGAVTNTGDETGGFAGYNDGIIDQSYATGAVQGRQATGGLVGDNDSALIERSYAIGSVSGTTDVGGLAGISEDGSFVENSYALGAATGTANVGGLVGHNSSHSSIEDVYSIGAVTGTTAVGGLVGLNEATGTITSGYLDTETSGAHTAIGSDAHNQLGHITSDTTAQLMNTLGALDASVWATGAGLLPFLQWQSPNATPQAITGKAYSDTGTTPLASGASGAVTVSALVNGASVGSGTTGVNGFYYILAPADTLTGTQQLLTYVNDNAVHANGFVQNADGNTGVDLYGNTLRAITGAANASSLTSAITAAIGSHAGSDFLYSGTTITPGADLDLEASNTSGFVFNEPIDVGSGSIKINAAGPVTQSAALTAAHLDLEGASASYALNNASNAVGTIAANTGGVSFSDSVGLTAETVTSRGAVTIRAAVDLTIDTGALVTAGSGDNIVLSATGKFTNNEGSDAVGVSNGGRWLIYSSAPGTDTFGSLNSANTAIWDATYATLTPGSVTQSGDRYIFAQAPTLTVTTTDVNKEYGVNGASAVAASYTITGLQSGVTGAFLGDTASVYSGTPAVTSSGSVVTASVAGNPYAIDASAGSFVASDGYSITYDDSGELAVTARPITITANSQSREYGNANPALTYSIGGDGLVNGDALSGALTTAAMATSNVGGYSITQGTLASSQNYDVTFDAGTLSVTTRPITIAANDMSKVYGTSDPTLTYSIGGDGLVNGDTLMGSLTRVAGENVAGGPYAIGQGTLAASSNYDVSFTGAQFTIDPATLTASLVGTVEKTYDGTTLATIGDANYSLNGIVGSDSVALNTFTGTYAGKNVGSGLRVSATGLVLTGADASNYVLASNTVSAAIGKIDPASLTITADDITAATVDSAKPTAQYSGFVTGEGPSLVSGLAFAIIPSDSATLFAVLPYGATAPNYDITFVVGALTVSATAVIPPFEIPGISAQIWDLTDGTWVGQVPGFNVLPIIIYTSGYSGPSPALVTTGAESGSEYVFTSGTLLPRFDIDFTALLKMLDSTPHLKTASL